MTARADSLGVVVIGRNEGERLRRCLLSVLPSVAVVYVDSGSQDESVSLARALGVEVVELDPATPFTAGRARNEGFDRLLDRNPSIEFVMFVDGDCEVNANWLPNARAAFAADPHLGAAAGRLRERFPLASIYNRLCEMEWDVRPGEGTSCGGIAVFRVSAFRAAGRFDPRIIAGEEPELCVRLRTLGWKIARLDAEMALHDAAMKRFSQWWRRAVRAGHAYAEGAALHGRPPVRHFVREARSAWIFGLAIPLVALLATLALGPWGLLPLAIYPLLTAKIAAGRRRSHRDRWAIAVLYAAACVLAKPAECLGELRYWSARLRGSRSKILEYKR